ncbi:MAG: hypothetical protein AB7L91_16210 [Dehalococcoidia bacterium]
MTTQRPTFTWTHSGVTAGSPGGWTTGYEIVVDGVGIVTRFSRAGVSGTGPFSATSTVDLQEDGDAVWSVVAIGLGDNPARESGPKRTVRIASPPRTPPAILAGPAGATSATTHIFRWSGQRVASVWSVSFTHGPAVASGEAGRGGGQAAVGPLADGAYTFRVGERSITGEAGPQASRLFVVDTQAPALPTMTSVPPFPTLNANPRFAWSGIEIGASATWQVLGPRGAVVRGPVESVLPTTTVGPLAAGTYVFQLRQSDAAGNVSAWRSETFTVAPGATVSGTRRLPQRNAGALRPKAGARLATPRPVLTWRRSPRARLYNVQIFRVDGQKRLTKIRSEFPRGTRFRIPVKRPLDPGLCYVWRVWPYLGTRFTDQPLGVSNFCVSRTARAR